MITFAAIVSAARRRADMTAAEFDYSLTTGGQALAELGNTIYVLANEGHGGTSGERQQRAEMLRAEMSTEIDAMISAAKKKSYTGWSDESRARGRRIRYAD